MEVQEVVRLAKRYLADVFQDESPKNIGLEEIEFDERDNEWDVTLGFSRPWDSRGTVLATAMGAEPPSKRTYKVVRISNADGRMLAIKLRPSVEAS